MAITIYNVFDTKSSEEKALEKFGEAMIKKIESFNGKWEKPWFSGGGMMPESIDGRMYNGMNLFYLLLVTDAEGYKAPIFATFDNIRSLNYKGHGKGSERMKDKNGNDMPYVKVKEGEESYPAFYFQFKVVHMETKETIKYDEYLRLNAEEKAEYKVYPNLRLHCVFNIDQTNMSEARPDLYKKLVGKNSHINPYEGKSKFRFDIADRMVDNNLWYCPITPKEQDGAYYSPSKDKIVIPTIEQFKTGEAYYSTMFHEMAHSTGHKDRINRLKENASKEEYGKEELIAEMTAAPVCHLSGFNNGIKEESAAYLKSWCKNIKEEPKYIKDILFEVRKSFKMISDKLNEIKATPQKTKRGKKVA